MDTRSEMEMKETRYGGRFHGSEREVGPKLQRNKNRTKRREEDRRTSIFLHYISVLFRKDKRKGYIFASFPSNDFLCHNEISKRERERDDKRTVLDKSSHCWTMTDKGSFLLLFLVSKTRRSGQRTRGKNYSCL
jgi:hypothetical protein